MANVKKQLQPTTCPYCSISHYFAAWHHQYAQTCAAEPVHRYSYHNYTKKSLPASRCCSTQSTALEFTLLGELTGVGAEKLLVFTQNTSSSTHQSSNRLLVSDFTTPLCPVTTVKTLRHRILTI